MKERSEILEFYGRELEPTLIALDGQRRALVNRALISLGVTIVAAGATALLTIPGGRLPMAILPAAILLVVGLVVTGLITWGPASRYTHEFKQRVIRPIVGFFDPSLDYSPTGMIPEGLYMSSRIFTHRPDRYKGDDLVTGTLGKTSIRFSELHTQYKTTSRDSKGRTKTNWHTIFKGLFFVADFNKHFQGRTMVLPDVAERFLGRLGKMLQSWNFTRDQLIKLEDPEFEKEFAVYGTDQVEARYILSPALMERILRFKREAKRMVHISFVDSSIFVAISYNRPLFEPRIFRSLVDFSAVAPFFQDLQLAIGLVEDLNLNTRIWSKE